MYCTCHAVKSGLADNIRATTPEIYGAAACIKKVLIIYSLGRYITSWGSRIHTEVPPNSEGHTGTGSASSQRGGLQLISTDAVLIEGRFG